jgi:hypothetical protein
MEAGGNDPQILHFNVTFPRMPSFLRSLSQTFYIKIFISYLHDPEGKRPLGRPRCRWENNIKMDLMIGWGDMDWTDLDQDRDQWRALVNTVMSRWVPQNVTILE